MRGILGTNAFRVSLKGKSLFMAEGLAFSGGHKKNVQGEEQREAGDRVIIRATLLSLDARKGPREGGHFPKITKNSKFWNWWPKVKNTDKALRESQISTGRN